MRTRPLLLTTVIASLAVASTLRSRAQAVTPTALPDSPAAAMTPSPTPTPTPTAPPDFGGTPAAPAVPDTTAATPAAPAPAATVTVPTADATAAVEGATAPVTTTVPAKPAETAAVVTPASAPATLVVADATAAAAPSASDVVVKADEGKGAVTKSKDQTGKDTLSVDFPDEDIRNILRNVADLFELNLVIPDTLQGKATVKLRDVTWRQIFSVVLGPVGYNYVEDGNIIKIVSNDSLQQEPTSTEVFTFNYARAADILPTLNSLVEATAGGRIVIDSRSNSLVITERPSRMNRIRPIIEILDRATDQVMIETKFIEVTASDVKNVGVNWSSLAGYNVGLQPTGNFTKLNSQDTSGGTNGNTGTTGSNSTSNTGTTTNSVTGTQTSGATTTSGVTSTNGTPATTSTTSTTGTTGTTSGSGTTGAVTNILSSAATSAFNSLTSLANTGNSTRSLSAVFSADQFSLVLSALQTLQSTKIVSNPTIVTLNNTEATINVGTDRPIPNYTFNEQRGTFEVSGFTYKPIGVTLKVTPQVNSRGYIKLTVEPEVSQSSRDETFNGANIPIVDSRRAKTQVSLKDGYTMGIGGLIADTTTNSTTKVPVLGSLPVLGRLFRSEGKNVQTTNLLIFITAKAVPPEGAPVEDVFDPRMIRAMKVQREDLPGYRDGSPAFIAPDAAPAKKSYVKSASAATDAKE